MIPIQQPGQVELQKIQDFTAEQQNLELDYNQFKGSVKINDDLHRLCLAAVQGRIESTQEYNESRIEKVNSNWKTYYSQKNAGMKIEKDNPLSNYNGTEAFNACQDHLDDYQAIFNNWQDQLDVSDPSLSGLEYVATKLKMDETDEDPKMAKLRAIYNGLPEEDKAELLMRSGVSEISDINDVFYYQKKQAIISFMKDIVERSGYDHKAEEAFLNLIVTGHLVVRDSYDYDCTSQLTRKETGEFEIEINRTPKSKFVVVDTRNLIFGPTTEWTIEKVHVRFSDLLNKCLDGNGKPVPNCPYDIEQIKKLGDTIKRLSAGDMPESPAGQVVNESIINGYFDQGDFSDLYAIDGNITLYEAHNIPMTLSGSSKVYKTVITAVNLDGDKAQPTLFVIGAKKSPYIDGKAHSEINMFFLKDNRAGIGVIDVIYPNYQILNSLGRQLMDLTKPGRSGAIITMGDSDTPIKIKIVEDREIISLKVGPRSNQTLKDLIQPWPTDYNMVTVIQNLIPLIEQRMKMSSRKGASGEKMAPNPSATEFSQITNELQKSVNLIAIKINTFLKDWVKRSYIYTIVNTFENLALKVQMERLDKHGNFTTTEKVMDFSVSDLFIDGIDIELKAYDNFQNTATQKQQIMQITNLLYTSGVIKNPATGQPVILIDEAGGQYQISEYKLLKMILEKFDMDSIISQVTTNQAQQAMQPPIQGNEGMIGMTPDQVPPLNAGTTESDIMAQSQLSQGMTV